ITDDMSVLLRFVDHITLKQALSGPSRRLLPISIALAGCAGVSDVDAPGAPDGGAPDVGQLEGTTLFADDFEDGVPDGWTIAEGSWAMIADGSQAWHIPPADPLARASAGSTDWTHYRAQVRIKT